MTEDSRATHETLFPRPHRIFSVLLSAWLLFPVTVVSFLVILGLERANHEFEEHAYQIHDEVESRIRENNSVLNGFAAFLAVAGRTQRAEITQYATALLKEHDDIYAFEIVEKIEASNLPGFMNEMHLAGYHQFTIHDYDASGTERFQPAPLRATYYPLSVVVSLAQGSGALLGLDIGQVSYLNEAMQVALNTDGIYASQPFHIYQEGMGYALFTRINTLRGKSAPDSSGCLAMLVIRTADLLPASAAPGKYGFHITLSSSHHGNVTPSLLIEHGELNGGWWAEKLLPKLRYHQRLTESQLPLEIMIEEQLSWRDINLHIIILVTLVASITFSLLQLYARSSRRSEQRRVELEALLHYKAHHDDLTGLPNRTLIIDRMEQGLRSAQRDHETLAVLFLDLNGFKSINDNYGHKAGDEVLREVALRLRTVVRERDTVGRLSGDEFVMLLAATDRIGGEVVIAKIKTIVETPIDVGIDMPLSIGVSVGCAIYPDDGVSAMELLRVADGNMYRDKSRRYARSR